MQRTDLETWFTHHPDSIHTDPAVLLDQCESEVRDHAHRDAWIHAKEIAEESLHRFERVFGLPASDIFVTREVCHEIARELRRNEPHPEDDAVEWVGSGVLEALDSDARRLLQGWLKELAAKEEHSAWREIVYFTDHLARSLIKKANMTSRLDWDLEHSYPHVAARVARMMIREFDAHVSDPAVPAQSTSPSH